MGFYRRLSIEILGDRFQSEILRFLYKNRPNHYTQKQISDALKLHPSSVSRTFSKLEQLNVISRFNAGKSILYQLDMESYFTKKIIVPPLKNEENFFRDLAGEITASLSKKQLSLFRSIYLFGSILNDEDTSSSDIDIAVIMNASIQTEEIKRHLLAKIAEIKLPLDIHFFVEGETSKKRGLSLDDIYKKGSLIWERKC